jgi:predicted DsbA family dithiol-disulfide isomerase
MIQPYFFLSCFFLLSASLFGQITLLTLPSSLKKTFVDSSSHKMQVEIWSDIMCPFCYIGKRKFEEALAQFPEKDKIELTWKSYQLSPDMKTDSSKSINQFLAEHKGISVQEAKRMNDYVTEMAKKVGLEYHFDKTMVANSFNAHRFAHYAKEAGKQDEAEEKLFSAYFTEGKNLDDFSTLIGIGTEIGLDSVGLQTALENGHYADEVRKDIAEAEEIGVQGVPFFVFNQKYAVTGAQDSKVFLQALERAYEDWKKETKSLD